MPVDHRLRHTAAAPRASAAPPPAPGSDHEHPSVSTDGIQVARTSARSPRPMPRSRGRAGGPAPPGSPRRERHAAGLVVEDAGAVVGERVHPVGQRVVVDRDQQLGARAARRTATRGQRSTALSVVRVISTRAPAVLRAGGGARARPPGWPPPPGARSVRWRRRAGGPDPPRSAGPRADRRRSIAGGRRISSSRSVRSQRVR